MSPSWSKRELRLCLVGELVVVLLKLLGDPSLELLLRLLLERMVLRRLSRSHYSIYSLSLGSELTI